MAHEVETMAWAGEVPWHGLGVKVNPDLTAKQMLIAAGLDWNVDEVPLIGEYKGEQINSGKKLLVRDSDKKVLTVTSSDWNDISNHDQAEFFHEFVENGDMEMHTAGSLCGGEIVWFLAKIVGESFAISKGKDEVCSYLLFTNYHRYGYSTDFRITAERVVCHNTLSAALRTHSNNMLKLHHRKVFNADEIKTTMNLASSYMKEYKEAAEFLAKKKYKAEALIEYYNEIFPTGSKKEDKQGAAKISRAAKLAADIVETQPGAEFARGSWWNGFNAVTFLTDHTLGHNDDSRLTSSWYGEYRNKKEKALKKALEYAEVA